MGETADVKGYVDEHGLRFRWETTLDEEACCTLDVCFGELRIERKYPEDLSHEAASAEAAKLARQVLLSQPHLGE